MVSQADMEPCRSRLEILNLDLRPQLDHSIEWQIEEAQVAVSVLQHEGKQSFPPTRHPHQLGRNHRLAAQEVCGAHRAEIQVLQAAQLQRLRHIGLIDKTEVQNDPEEPFSIRLHLEPL